MHARLFAPVVRIEGWKEGVWADFAPRVGLKITSNFSKRPKGINEQLYSPREVAYNNIEQYK